MVSRRHLNVTFVRALPALLLCSCYWCCLPIIGAVQPFSFHQQFVLGGSVYVQQDIAPQWRAKFSQRCFFFWRRMGRSGKVVYPPWFHDLIILDSVNCTSELKNQGHRRTGDPNDSVYRHFTIDNARSMPLTWTSLSTMRWSWWWSFEILRKATQQQINVLPVCLLYSSKSVYTFCIYIYIYIYIQGESLARGPKLLSIKNYVIKIMAWKFIYTYRERCKTGPAHNSKLKLVSFHNQPHLNAFLQILEYFSQSVDVDGLNLLAYCVFESFDCAGCIFVHFALQ